MTEPTERRDAHGAAVDDPWDEVGRTHPAYLAAIHGFRQATAGDALDPKVRAFVRLAVNASVTHLRQSEIRRAIRDALAAGATTEEIFEVLLVTCTLGVHGMNAGTLSDVLAERGTAEPPLSAEQTRLREDYRRTRGYWRDFLDPTLALAPDFLAAYLDFSGAPWREGVLEAKVREFLYLAFDTSPMHLHMPGLRVHIDNALGHGATVAEIVAVMSIAAGTGLQTLDVGMEMLRAELSSLSD